jgi:CRISPR-associated protein Cas5d
MRERPDYEFSFEIAGPMAMFMRPDTGSTPGSYPVPTCSAIKAMAESIALVEGAWFQPTIIEVCHPIRYSQYATNYGGPLRKQDQIKKNASFQLVARVLVDPCFKVHGRCVKEGWHNNYDPAMKLRGMLERRLADGQSRFPACLGWKEFAPTYFGLPRATTKRDSSVNETVEGYLVQVWSKPQSGIWQPRFQTVMIESGLCDLTEAWRNVA